LEKDYPEKNCLTCGQIFKPREAEQKSCREATCLARRDAQRRQQYEDLGGCLECGVLDGHSEFCPQRALIVLGHPAGPCPYCGGGIHNHTERCRLAMWVHQNQSCPICGRYLDPQVVYPDVDSITKDHILPQSKYPGQQNQGHLRLTHRRCNECKDDDITPYGVRQPAWGVLPEVPHSDYPHDLTEHLASEQENLRQAVYWPAEEAPNESLN
jgi:hypothetical protein